MHISFQVTCEKYDEVIGLGSCASVQTVMKATAMTDLQQLECRARAETELLRLAVENVALVLGEATHFRAADAERD